MVNNYYDRAIRIYPGRRNQPHRPIASKEREKHGEALKYRRRFAWLGRNQRQRVMRSTHRPYTKEMPASANLHIADAERVSRGMPFFFFFFVSFSISRTVAKALARPARYIRSDISINRARASLAIEINLGRARAVAYRYVAYYDECGSTARDSARARPRFIPLCGGKSFREGRGRGRSVA